MKRRIDPLTLKVFHPERKNQRFSSAQNRIRYNSLKAKTNRSAVRTINKVLSKNRRILTTLLGPRSEYVVHQLRLTSFGYNFSYFTHLVPINTQKKKFAAGIYDVMLISLINGYYRILPLNSEPS